MCSKTFYTSKMGLGYTGNSAISLSKKTDINLQALLCLGHYAFHDSVSLTRLQLPFLIFVYYIRLVYCMSNFPVVAIALTTLLQDTFQFVTFNPWKVLWNWIAFYQNSFVISPGCYISWLDVILDNLQTRFLGQILLFLWNNSLTI